MAKNQKYNYVLRVTWYTYKLLTTLCLGISLLKVKLNKAFLNIKFSTFLLFNSKGIITGREKWRNCTYIHFRNTRVLEFSESNYILAHNFRSWYHRSILFMDKYHVKFVVPGFLL